MEPFFHHDKESYRQTATNFTVNEMCFMKLLYSVTLKI